jgi:hypothetical protein
MTGKKKISDNFEFLTKACVELKDCLENNDTEMPKDRLEMLRKRVSECAENAENTLETGEKIAEFEKLCKEYTSKLHCLYQSRDLARWEHYTLKMDICEEIRRLSECQDQELPRVARELKLIRLRWKDIGSVPHEKSEEIWNEFCSECDKLQERITQYYNRLEEKRNKIAVEKVKICEQAEKIQDSTDWENTAREFKELQKLWRDIGFTAPEKEKELYLRFRASCDVFFDARKAHYQQSKQERDYVSSVKYQLCEEAKNIFELSYSKAHQLIPDLWKRWKTAGSAGKHDRELYERFRGYFDTYYEGLRSQRKENLEIKKQICVELENIKNKIDDGEKTFAELKGDYLELKRRWDSTGAMPRAEEQPVIDEYVSLNKALDAAAGKPVLDNKKILKRSYELEQIASAALESLDEKKMNDWEKYRSQWEAVKSAEKRFFHDSFNAISEAFEKQNDENCEKLITASNENLKKREQICEELESLAEKAKEKTDNTDLAEELTNAIVNNFAEDEVVPDSNPVTEKINALARRWLKAGVVPLEELPGLYKRFEKAMKKAQEFKQ